MTGHRRRRRSAMRCSRPPPRCCSFTPSTAYRLECAIRSVVGPWAARRRRVTSDRPLSWPAALPRRAGWLLARLVLLVLLVLPSVPPSVWAVIALLRPERSAAATSARGPARSGGTARPPPGPPRRSPPEPSAGRRALRRPLPRDDGWLPGRRTSRPAHRCPAAGASGAATGATTGPSAVAVERSTPARRARSANTPSTTAASP